MTGIWERLRGMFRRPDPISPEESAARVAAVVAYMRERRRPCLYIVDALAGGGLSRLGGLPPAAPGLEWPRCEGRPLSFLARLELAEVREVGGPEWLPDHGRLLFFIDMESFDARDSWAVVHSPDGPDAPPLTPPPDLPKKRRYEPRAVGFAMAASYPIHERSWHLSRDFSEEEDMQVEADLGVVERTDPNHQIGGYPQPIQDDFMEAECQRALDHGFAPAPAPKKGTAPDLSPTGFEDWRLLLQLDSDDAMGSNWGDGGMLYFWIREQDARSGDFSRVWTIMQCY